MDQQFGTILREEAVAILLGLAGLSVFVFSMAETPWMSLNSGQALLAVLLTGAVILADQRPIHLGRGTKATLASLPIYLGTVLLPAPFALFVAGGGLLISNLLARADRGLLPRDIVSTAGQWTLIAFLGYQVGHLVIPGLDQHLDRFILKKNRKARRLQELHPEVNIRVLYQRDYLHLLVKYGLEPPSQLGDDVIDAAPLRLDADVRRAAPRTSEADRLKRVARDAAR